VLQSAGIAGSVDLQFIVDTTGHVEPNSLKVWPRRHDAFVEPAKEAVMKGSYKPARYKGEPVRQQVQQRIQFQTN
jgi:TonB family protein